MALWLFKQEPDCYPYSQLEADGQTFWDGVANPLALKHLRTCAAGDLAFFYHTGDEKAVVGVMEVTGPPVVDADDPKEVAVPVKPLRKLANPVTLAAIKADPVFANPASIVSVANNRKPKRNLPIPGLPFGGPAVAER